MSAADSTTLRLETRGLGKVFGKAQVLVDLDFTARAGEIHAVLGENGAGKSTFMNLLSGAFEPSQGQMLLDGAPYAPKSPKVAEAQGVAIVHQELLLCPHLSAAENILLGREPSSHGLLNAAAARNEVAAALTRLWPAGDWPFSVDARLSSLSIAQKQLVEIARALAKPNCRLLILDEPTSSLNEADIARLFGALRGLAAQGISILYISHFLDEVLRLADSYTVLRDGRKVKTGSIAETSASELTASMAGRSVEASHVRKRVKRGACVLEVRELSGAGFKSASFSLHRGEVLGIAGLLGSGRTELLRAIFGLAALRHGHVKLGVHLGAQTPTTRWRHGAGFLSEDRKTEGLALSLSIAQNLTLSKLAKVSTGPFISHRKESSETSQWLEKLGIRANSSEQKLGFLSGGNQQKVALARLLYHDVDVLFLDEPTRGIDVRSRFEIYRWISDLAAAGKAILMVSSHFPELLNTCDAISVMYRGVLAEPRPACEFEESSLIAKAMGS